MPFERDQAAAYLAGLIDGEGSVTMTGDKKARRVSIANTEYTLIETACECCETLGIEFRVYPRKHQLVAHPEWKPAWDVCIFGRVNFEKVKASVPIRHPDKVKMLDAILSSYRFRKVPTRDEIHQAYIIEGLSYSKIALRFGFKSLGSINQLLKRYGIEPRSLSEAAKLDWASRAISQ